MRIEWRVAGVIVRGLAAGQIAAMCLDDRQGRVKDKALLICRQLAQVYRQGQCIGQRRLVDFAIFENQGQRLRIQRVAGHAFNAPACKLDAPGVGIDGRGDMPQAGLVIQVQLLEMLRIERETFGPQDF